MKKKFVSIIIPVYDMLYYTRQCVEGILQTTQEDLFELIVIDNGSAEAMQEYLGNESARIKNIRNNVNLGFAKACNQGAAAAEGEHLVFLNNDTVPHPGWLEALLKIAASGNDIGAVGSKLLFPNGTVQHCGIVFSFAKHPFQIYRGCPADIPCVNKVRDYQAVTAACMLVPKKRFQDAGGFDETYINGCEDVDLGLKLHASGLRCVYTPECVVSHFEGRSPDRQAKMKENFAQLLKKWSSTILHDDSFFFGQDSMTLLKTPFGIGYKNMATGEEYLEPEGCLNQAITWFNSGESRKALAFFDELLAHDPYHEFALKTLGDVSVQLKNYPAAIGFYRKLLELHPHNPLLGRIVSDLQTVLKAVGANLPRPEK
jgi:GT2 family glycosyltransferase